MNDELFRNNLNSDDDAAPEEATSSSPETEPVFVPQPEPAFSGSAASDAFKSSINIKHKKKRFPGWAIALICIIGAIYLFVSITAIFGLVNLFSNGNISFDQNSGGFKITPSNGSSQNDMPPVEEHLKLSETPDSDPKPSTSGGLTIKEISKKVRSSVVGVTCESAQDFSGASVGSGIIMSSDGYIITNNHVIEGANKIQVVLDDGKTYAARLIGSDTRTDLAVIKIEAKDLPVAEFGNSDKLEQGDLAVAIGNPAGLQLQNTVTSGIISAINRDIMIEDRTMTLIQTDASINPGNSGGPLLNEFGQVIGINTVKIGVSYYEGLGFAIPINTAKPIIDELISYGYIKGRPSIGISGTSLSERDSVFYNLPRGLLVDYVHPRSDAFAKGLRRGDVITKMNGTELSSTAEIKKIRDNFKAGDTVTITVYRNGSTADLNVVLMDEAELSNADPQS